MVCILPSAPKPAVGPSRPRLPNPAAKARLAPPPIMPKALTERYYAE